MSQWGFQVFDALFPLGAELLYAVLLAYFLRPFRRGDGGWRSGPLPVLGIYLALRLLCGLAGAPRGAFGLGLTALLALLAGTLGLERAAALLLSLFYWSARISGGLAAESLYFLLERSLPPPEAPPEALYLRAAVLIVLFLLVHGALFGAMLWGLRRRLRRRRVSLHRREVCYLGLVPAAGILFGQVISRLLIEVEDGVLLQLYQRHPALLAVVPALALLFYAGTWMSVAFQQGMDVLREERAAAFAERRQTELLRERIGELERHYAQVRELRHQLRGHLTAIRGLVRSGEYGGLEAYIGQIDGDLRDFAVTLQTGNPVTDVIVNDIRGRCLELGIVFEAEFHCPEAFDAFDLGIILQNLLQNAVEACGREPEGCRAVSLTGRRRGRFFLIQVKNTCTRQVAFGPDGLPVTSKGDDSLHGIGLPSVRREAEKYMGELELRADGQEFSAAVLLQERSE